MSDSFPTVEKMVEASLSAFSLEMNAPQTRLKPRASGIGDCARKQAYSMANAGVTNRKNRDGALTTEQGRVIEDLSVELIRAASDGRLVVANRQVELPPDYVMTGHPDGQVVPIETAWWDYSCRTCGVDGRVVLCAPSINGHEYRAVGWRAPLDTKVDGKVVGFEHKHLGRFGFTSIFKEGFAEAEPSYYAQTLSYGDALGWDKVKVIVLAQDSSATQSEATMNLKYKNPKVRWAHKPDWNPKLQIIDVNLEPMVLLQKRIRMRAEWLTKVIGVDGVDPGVIAREANPEDNVKDSPVVMDDGSIGTEWGPDFPCSHCPWLQRCLDDGQGKLVAPKLVM